MFIIDSHCHLDYYQDDELVDLLKRCNAMDVVGLLNVSVDLQKFDMIFQRTKAISSTWCSLGHHPSYANNNNISYQDINALYNKYDSTLIIAIGECGLDYIERAPDFLLQQQLFEQHLLASSKMQLPLIVHTRNAEDDTHAMIANYSNISGVIHCFTGSMEFMKKMLDLGFYISFSGIVTFKNADNLRECLRYMPLDRILIETDSPYLAPIPHRGKRNEPSFVKHVAKAVSDILDISEEKICNTASSNFATLFNIDIPNIPLALLHSD